MKLRQMERENDVALEKQQVEVRRQQAEADYYAQTKDAEARAEARMAEGKAEAEVIREKSLAEAEAIERRAQAMAEHKDVIILEQLIEIMPEFARAVSDSLNNVNPSVFWTAAKRTAELTAKHRDGHDGKTSGKHGPDDRF